MTREEFITLVRKNDRLYGNYTSTLPYMKRREKRLANANEKIIRVAEYLHSKGIRFMTMEAILRPSAKNPMFADIYIPKYRIFVRNVDDSDTSRKSAQIFYHLTQGVYYQIFSRHDEDVDFVLMKVENTIEKAVQKPLVCKFSPEPTKKKKERIKAVRA